MNYLVIDRGRWRFSDGTLIQADTLSTARHVGNNDALPDEWETVALAGGFADPPAVFCQVLTETNAAWVTEILRNVTAGQFQAALENGELSAPARHTGAETLGWAAVESGVSGILGDSGDNDFESLLTGDNVAGHDNNNTTGYLYNFARSFDQVPLVLTDQQKRDGNNGGWTMIRSVTVNRVGVHVDEDQEGDGERSHTSEDVSVFALERAGNLPLKQVVDDEPVVSVETIRDQLVLLGLPQSVSAGQVSGPVRVQLQNVAGTPVNAAVDTQILLGSDSESGEFSLSAFPFVPVSGVVLAAGTSETTFYYRDDTIGEWTITAAETPALEWENATGTLATTEVFVPGSETSAIEIDNTGGAALANHAVLLEIDTQALVSQGVLRADGADLRFFDDAALATPLDYWIESGINTASTRIWIEVSSIPANGTRDIYMNYGNPAAYPRSSIAGAMVSAESGTVTAGAAWESVVLEKRYADPVVAALYECDGGEESSVRIRNLGETSFDIRLQNPGNRAFADRTVHYLVAERGDWTTLSGHLVEADRYTETHTIGSASGDNTWNSIGFSHAFVSAPALFSQVMSFDDERWITGHTAGIGAGNADIAMEVGQLGYAHDPETMGWIAVESGVRGDFGCVAYETGLTADFIQGHDNNNSSGYVTAFSQAFSSVPVLLADLATRDGGDGGWVSLRSINTAQFGLHVEEEDESDGERSHTTERAGWIALGAEGAFPLARYAAVTPLLTVDLPPAQIVFSSPPRTVLEDRVSDAMTLELQNVLGNPVPAPSDLTILLSTTSPEGEFSLNAAFTQGVSSVTIPQNASTVSFYYRDGRVGVHTLTAAEDPSGGLLDATQPVTVEDVYVWGSYRQEIVLDNTGCSQTHTDFQVPLTIDTLSLVNDGKMNADGSDIRFLDEDGVTTIPYWIQSGINTPNTLIWVKAPLIPANGTRTISLYYGNPALGPASSMILTMENSETGVAAGTDANWRGVALSGVYRDPVVVCSHEEAADGMEVAPRVRNAGAGATSFELCLENPGGSAFAPADVFYWAIESGVLATLAGHRIEAGARTESTVIGRNIGNNNTWSTVNLTGGFFTGDPYVFAQVMSADDPRFITDHVNDPDAGSSSFELALEACELSYPGGSHDPERVGWIAVEPDVEGLFQGPANLYYQFGGQNNVRGHDNGWTNVSLSRSSGVVAADMQTRRGGDGGWVSLRGLPGSTVGMHIEEDRVNDSERSHTTETVGFAAFDGTGFAPLRKHSDCAIGQTFGSEALNIQRLAYVDFPSGLVQDEVSAEITVETQGASGTAIDVASDTVIRFASSSATGRFSPDGAAWSATLDLVIPAGDHEAAFHYRDSSIGNPSLTAFEYPSMGWTDAVDTLVVSRRRIVFASFSQTVRQGEVSTEITIQTVGPSGTAAPVSADTVITLSSTSPLGEFSGDDDPFTPVTSLVIPSGGSEADFYYRDASVGIFILRAEESPDQGWLAGEQSVTVTPAADHFEVTAPERAVSGVPFDVRIEAVDADGEVNPAYTGSISLFLVYADPVSGTRELEIRQENPFVDGIAQVSVAYPDAGTIQVGATDDSDSEITGTSDAVLVVPYDFRFDDATAPDQVAARPFTLSVRAVNRDGVLTPNFSRVVALEAIPVNPPDLGAGEITPEVLAFEDGTAGGGKDFRYGRWGTVRFFVRDSLATSGIERGEALSEPVSFHPAAFRLSLSDPPRERDYYYIDEVFDLGIEALDFENQTLTGYRGTVSFQLSLPGPSVLERYAFLEQDRGIRAFRVFSDRAGVFGITVTDTEYVGSATSADEFEVKNGTLVIEPRLVPVGTTEVILKILDDDGVVLTDDLSTEFTVALSESNANGSASSPAVRVPVTVNRGTASFPLTDTEAETVTVRAESVPELDSESVEITFVTGGAVLREGGMRFDYWREVKSVPGDS